MKIDDLSEDLRKLVVKNNYESIKAKAERYLEVGPENYSDSAFHKTFLKYIKESDLANLKSGCEQILEYRGLTADRSFQGLSIKGFYHLMRMFHFYLVKQHSYIYQDEFLDEIIFRHATSEDEITLFSKNNGKKQS